MALAKERFPSFEEIGEALRPKGLRGEVFRFSREERDYIAGHALNSLALHAETLSGIVRKGSNVDLPKGSPYARKIAALSNLLDDIGWEREGKTTELTPWTLGELFPVAQLWPWLEEWQRQDGETLARIESNLEVALVAEDEGELEVGVRQGIAAAQTKLGAGAILLARIEKWMASHGN